jgi:aspartate/methionine/tyrosine aminotransferase
MSDLLLAKPKLDDTWIDCGPGEPYIVYEALEKYFDLSDHILFKKENWQYPSPNGAKNLIDLLESQYQAPVVITNGAKGGLAATFYALNKMGYNTIEMRNPYWALIPPLATQHGLNSIFTNDFQYKNPYLYLNPNNPDGYALSYDESLQIYDKYVSMKIPFIHDAAYYSHIYMPQDYELKPIGDVAIYSASKSYGLSGLRLGYCVCYNKDYYNYLVEYQEMMTVGVSSISQEFFYSLLNCIKDHPCNFNDFTLCASKELYNCKLALKNINPNVLEVPKDFEHTDGMFAFLNLNQRQTLILLKLM